MHCGQSCEARVLCDMLDTEHRTVSTVVTCRKRKTLRTSTALLHSYYAHIVVLSFSVGSGNTGGLCRG